ncbi:RDD family protein [Cohnella suwonensis]|uniref:RDD family protein n=1 Tax=Cohnella suwonensis TaxID=696072 RepID=A0ABW0M0H1_9BACL
MDQKTADYLPSTTIESIASTYGPSLFFRRWAATIIDTLILAGFIGMMALGEKMGDDYLAIAFLLWIAIIISYYLLLEGFTGYTLGKFFLRIQAVNEEGRVPGFVKSLIRTVLRLVDTNPLLMGGLPAGISVLATRKKQRLGDMAAKTFVVKVRDLNINSKGKTTILAVAFSILAIVSVSSGVYGISSIIRDSQMSETYLSEDEQFQITVPSSWSSDSELHEDADISISNRYEEKYFVVLSESKQAFDEGTTLEEYETIVEDNFVAEMKSREFIVAPHNILVNGNSAIQFSFPITVDDIPTTYLVTVVETSSHFHQLVAWTLEEEYSGLEAELEEVAASFQEAVVMEV